MILINRRVNMTDEELMYIAWQELIKPLPQYKEPANISMPLDSGDNRKLPIRTFVGGDFGDPENMPGVVALSMKTNPSLAESCYNPRLQCILLTLSATLWIWDC